MGCFCLHAPHRFCAIGVGGGQDCLRFFTFSNAQPAETMVACFLKFTSRRGPSTFCMTMLSVSPGAAEAFRLEDGGNWTDKDALGMIEQPHKIVVHPQFPIGQPYALEVRKRRWTTATHCRLEPVEVLLRRRKNLNCPSSNECASRSLPHLR